jgi:hypothetical protein
MATAIMKRKRTQVGWSFWLQWVVATSIAWAFAGVLLTAFIVGLGDEFGNVVGVATLGFLTGVGQWVVLRQWLEKAGWWIPAGAGGFLLAASVGEVLQGALGENIGGLLLTVGLGLVPGILQWLVLRRQVMRAGWWVLASTILVFSVNVAGVGIASSLSLKESELAFGAVAGVVSGVVLGAMSGLVMGRLLRQPAPALPRTTPAAGRTTEHADLAHRGG